MKLIFIGENGSMGLERGKKYDCRIVAELDSNWIWVVAYADDRVVSRCPYTSMKKLLDNWFGL